MCGVFFIRGSEKRLPSLLGKSALVAKGPRMRKTTEGAFILSIRVGDSSRALTTKTCNPRMDLRPGYPVIQLR